MPWYSKNEDEFGHLGSSTSANDIEDILNPNAASEQLLESQPQSESQPESQPKPQLESQSQSKTQPKPKPKRKPKPKSKSKQTQIQRHYWVRPKPPQFDYDPGPEATAAAQIRRDPCHYDPSVRGSIPFYLYGRAANIVFAIVLVVLSVIADIRYDKGDWKNPILIPSLPVVPYSAYDLYIVYRHRRRVRPDIRIVFDGIILGTGLAVAGGILTTWAVDAADDIGYSVSAPILAVMFTMAAIEYSIGIGAIVQIMRMRRGTWMYQ